MKCTKLRFIEANNFTTTEDSVQGYALRLAKKYLSNSTPELVWRSQSTFSMVRCRMNYLFHAGPVAVYSGDRLCSRH